MTPEQFCYWLQGYSELNHQPPNLEQWRVIQAHLNTVFNKVTPSLPKQPDQGQPYPYVKKLEWPELGPLTCQGDPFATRETVIC